MIVKENIEDDDKEDDEITYKYRNSDFRIVVISDGCENKSEIQPYNLMSYLDENKIKVDTVFVSEKVDENNILWAVSNYTNGACVKLANSDDEIKIIDQSEFINTKSRIDKIKSSEYLETLDYLQKDIIKAIHYLSLAAKQNDANAQFYLG